MNSLIKNHLTSHPDFKKVYVRGEVSGAFVSRRGHLYFDLKDDSSKIKCAVFYRVRSRLPFKVTDGMEVLVIGRIDVFKERGEYQIVADKVNEDGLGQLFIRLQQVKEKLTREGLFNDEFKKPMPVFPSKIGVVTSHGGAGIRDILKAFHQKECKCEILLFPSLVQGKGAEEQLIKQIRNADRYGLDILIVGRGGGSTIDLWTFNDENLARVVFDCQTPVISAVGHQRDETLIDFVSDIRASTPTDAANRIVNQREMIENKLKDYNSRILNVATSKFIENRNNLDFILAKPLFVQKDYVYHNQKNTFDDFVMRFEISSGVMLKSRQNLLEKIKQEYVIRHPCKIQLDVKTSHLNELKTRLIDAMNSIINHQRVNLDKATNNFHFHSKNLLTGKRHSLEMSKSYFKTNPCQGQIDMARNDLALHRDRLQREIGLKIEHDKNNLEVILDRSIFKNPKKIYLNTSHEFESLKERFNSRSKELVLTKSYDLNSVKSAPAIKNRLSDNLKSNSEELEIAKSNLKKGFNLKILEKRKDLNHVLSMRLFSNPEMLYESKRDDLDEIKTLKIIRNPYLLLEDYRNELKIYEDKLENINYVIMLKKEQKRQKIMYIAIIVLIVVVLILIIIFGGIL